MNSTKQSSLTIGYLLAALTVLLWASFVLLSRIAGKSNLNPYDLTALRFSVASVVLLPVWLFWKKTPLFNLQMLTLALLGGLGYALGAYSGLSIAPASHGAVLLSGVLPFFMTIMAYLVLQEHPTQHRLIALAVIAIGVLCMAVYSLNNLQHSWPGDLILMASSALWALYTVLVKRWSKSPLEVTMGVALLSALLYMPVYVLLLPKNIQHAEWNAIVIQGVFHGILVVIVAMLCFMQAMQRLGPTRLGAVMAMVPAVAGLGAVFILQEPFSWLLVAGLAFTSAGAWLGARSSS